MKTTKCMNAHLASVAARALLVAMAGGGTAFAAGETIGYSAPFLMAQFEVVWIAPRTRPRSTPPLLSRLGDNPQVRLRSVPAFRELLLRVLVGH